MSETKQISIPVTGMTCANCVSAVERNIKKVEGVQLANVNLTTERAAVEYDPATATLGEMIDRIERAGYGIATGIADLAIQRMMPNWGVGLIDGFEGMEGNGPVSGFPVPHRIAIASTDFLAADRVGLECMGIDASWPNNSTGSTTRRRWPGSPLPPGGRATPWSRCNGWTRRWRSTRSRSGTRRTIRAS